MINRTIVKIAICAIRLGRRFVNGVKAESWAVCTEPVCHIPTHTASPARLEIQTLRPISSRVFSPPVAKYPDLACRLLCPHDSRRKNSLCCLHINTGPCVSVCFFLCCVHMRWQRKLQLPRFETQAHMYFFCRAALSYYVLTDYCAQSFFRSVWSVKYKLIVIMSICLYVYSIIIVTCNENSLQWF